MNYITYFAHGDVGYLNECRFSLLKLLHVYNLQPPANTAILVYTDQPQLFESFIPFFSKFVLETINDDIIKSWMNNTGYIHRAKTKMIQHALQTYGGNVLFFDTDTYITEPLASIWNDIDQGTVVFHKSEGVIDSRQNPSFKKWDRFLREATIRYGTKAFTYNKAFQVWNSGVLGLSPRYTGVLDDVLLLIDAIQQQFPKHITEQVACSYCFAQAATIKSSEATVVHYWNLKEFRHLLDVFFSENGEESIPNLVKLAAPINTVTMLEAKKSFKRLPLLQRLFKQITGKGWKIEQYEKRLSS